MARHRSRRRRRRLRGRRTGRPPVPALEPSRRICGGLPRWRRRRLRRRLLRTPRGRGRRGASAVHSAAPELLLCGAGARAASHGRGLWNPRAALRGRRPQGARLAPLFPRGPAARSAPWPRSVSLHRRVGSRGRYLWLLLLSPASVLASNCPAGRIIIGLSGTWRCMWFFVRLGSSVATSHRTIPAQHIAALRGAPEQPYRPCHSLL